MNLKTNHGNLAATKASWRPRLWMLQLLAVCAGLGICQTTRATAEERLEYNRDVRPILADNCFACHGADSAAREADLRIDQRAAAIEFGAVVPGAPDESELISRIISDDPELLMPPPETKKRLTAEQKATLQRWVAEGAEYQLHWSFIPPTKSPPPAVQDEAWSKNLIDRFVLAKLEANGLTPAPAADARTLFRRLHLDITGLPPNPEDAARFETDYHNDQESAVSDWIDRLLATPAWGEHRARYWLDAARYADTHGLHFDNYREMWPYRDWVIRAFNANQPFDQFTVDQLAGDLLDNPQEDQLIATGFQRCNITTNEGGTIDEENLANYAVDRVQTFGWVFLGLTTNCSQCHDHKFDPFTAKDYYSLAAYFRNTTQGPKDGNAKDGRGPILVLPNETDRPRWKSLPNEISDAIKDRNERKRIARQEFDQWLKTISVESLQQQLPSAGVLLRLPLNEGSGNVCRESVPEAGGDNGSVADPKEARTFTATGEIGWSDDGKLGPAPIIRAGSTFELGAIGDFDRQQPFSYGAAVKTANVDTSAAILARMDESAAHRGWDLWQNGKSFSVHLIDSWPDNSIKVSTQGSVVKPGEWQHVFVTYDGSGTADGVKIYVDGKAQKLAVDNATMKPDASLRTETPLRIGQRSSGSVFDGGAVQDLSIYDRMLSPAEIRSLSEYASLVSFVRSDAETRTKQQEQAAFDYYLGAHDGQYSTLAERVDQLEAEKESIRARSPLTHIQEEKQDTTAMAFVLMRGEYDRPGEQVEAATPAALHPLAEGAPKNRLGLARWLMDPANPMTARVTVNRFWQQVFGAGIVVTTEDFGVMGALPTHPELLDTLAVEFQEHGWDVQWLFKTMLMSATYRQSSQLTAAKLEQDRDNALLSRGPRFRMDAEMVRDVALASSGLLSQKMYGPGVKPYQPEAIWDVVGLPNGDTRDYQPSTGDDLYRRSLYSFWKRMAPPPNLEALNAPSREVCTVRRERTNTPLQALVTLNDPQFVEAARCLATIAIQKAGEDRQLIANLIAERVLGRPLTDQEVQIVLDDQTDFHEHYRQHVDEAKAFIAAGETAVDEALDPAMLASWTLVCNEILNLDETLNK